MEQQGYEFEKGRMKVQLEAQLEAIEAKDETDKAKK